MNFKERYSYNSQSDLLGVGGFSTIFLATDNLLGRKVALKFFPVDPGKKYSVLNEIRRVINLDHPNIVRFHDAAVLENTNVHGEIDKVEIGVMEFMDGGDLKNYLSRNQSTPDQIRKLLYDILLGLEYLHEHGIIHRDLKPQNILVKNTPKGPVAKLTDFGISKAADATTQTASTLLGSIEYMAPEQFNPAKFGINGKIGTNVDLWGFGIMTYEILSGISLFGNRSSGQTTEQVMNNILQREIAETDIAHLPDPWRSVVRTCVIKNANSRVKNARELLSMIDHSVNVVAPPATFVPPVVNHAVHVPVPNETQVIGDQYAHVVQANVPQNPDMQYGFNPAGAEIHQRRNTGQNNAGISFDSSHGTAPVKKKNVLPVWVIIGAGCVLITLICVISYFAMQPEVAESVYAAKKQYVESKEDGLRSLWYQASQDNDSAYAELADIYYRDEVFDSAAYYFQRMSDILSVKQNPYAYYYLMMLEGDDRLNRNGDPELALLYAYYGHLLDVAECTQYFDDYCRENAVVFDRELNRYDVVDIDGLLWMKQNLQTSCFRNGDTIRCARSSREWNKALSDHEPAWCYHNFDPDDSALGKYYNYYSIIDKRGLAPEGSHLPDNTEWSKLFELGSDALIESGRGWNGSNSSGFTAVAAGELYGYGGECNFYGAGQANNYMYSEYQATWWSSSTLLMDGQEYQYNVYVDDDFDSFVNGTLGSNRECGFPVRCVKDMN